MNIFVTDPSCIEAARSLCDIHVSKMTLETAQILSTAAHERGLTFSQMYAPYSPKHPCVQWAAQNMWNFSWLCNYGLHLSQEYRSRFRATHKSEQVILNSASLVQEERRRMERSILLNVTIPPLVAPDEYQDLYGYYKEKYTVDDEWSPLIETYREYYALEKATKEWATWKHREQPYWLQDYISRNKILWKKQNKRKIIEPRSAEIDILSQKLDPSEVPIALSVMNAPAVEIIANQAPAQDVQPFQEQFTPRINRLDWGTAESTAANTTNDDWR